MPKSIFDLSRLRFGTRYTITSKILLLLLAAGRSRRLVRGFVFASLTGDVSSLFRLTVEGGRPCVPSAGMSYCLDVRHLR